MGRPRENVTNVWEIAHNALLNLTNHNVFRGCPQVWQEFHHSSTITYAGMYG